MKKFLAIVLTLALVLGLCACVAPEEGVAGNKGTNGKIKLSIGLPTSAKVMSLEENALTRWVEETTGYELEFVEYAGGTDVATQISTTVAARKELPDIIYGINLNDDAIASYGKDGYFADLTPYYEDKEGASKVFWSRLEESLTEEQVDFVVRSITNGDTGKIYGVPTIETSTIDKRKYQPWINQTWLDKLGLPMPQSPEDLYNVLVAFNTQDPNGNGDPDDEIPLYASEKAGSSASAVAWLTNMFIYYHPDHRWQPDANGKLQYVYTQDAYREALKYINKLYKEELLTNMLYTASRDEMKQITTPASGTAMCGIFCAHLTLSCTMGNEVMYEYAPMPLWGYAVEGDMSCKLKTFITSDCDNPDEAFNLLMTLFSWEGSMRVRYGEYGSNWTDADPGSKSDMGLDANYKLISDPFTQQNTAHWGTIASCFNHYAEGETAQIAENMDEWTMKKSQLHAESRRIFDAAVEANNPEVTCPTLVTTTEEKEAVEMVRTNISTYASDMEMAFITGIGEDINDDASWNAFLAKLDEMGLAQYQNYVQTAYDRQ